MHPKPGKFHHENASVRVPHVDNYGVESWRNMLP